MLWDLALNAVELVLERVPWACVVSTEVEYVLWWWLVSVVWSSWAPVEAVFREPSSMNIGTQREQTSAHQLSVSPSWSLSNIIPLEITLGIQPRILNHRRFEFVESSNNWAWVSIVTSSIWSVRLAHSLYTQRKSSEHCLEINPSLFSVFGIDTGAIWNLELHSSALSLRYYHLFAWPPSFFYKKNSLSPDPTNKHSLSAISPCTRISAWGHSLLPLEWIGEQYLDPVPDVKMEHGGYPRSFSPFLSITLNIVRLISACPSVAFIVDQLHYTANVGLFLTNGLSIL